MIRTMLVLLPDGGGRRLARHLLFTVVSVILRVAGAVLLVPLVSRLLGADPASAWPWVGALAAATIAGWLVDRFIARIGFDLGFGLLDNAQHRVAEHLARVRLDWFTDKNTATAREAIAATGPDLVGLLVYLLTPLLSAVLLPVAIAIALLPISVPLGLVALAGVPLLLGAFAGAGRFSRDADRAAQESNSALTERIVEFARTQEALRAARRVEPARSRAGAALANQRTVMMRLLLLQVPGHLLFGLATQLALLAFAGTTAALAVGGDLGAAEAVALLVVGVRYLEAFTSLADLAPGLETAATTLGRLRTVVDAPVTGGGTSTAAPSGAPRVELRGITHAYRPGGPAALADVDLTFEPGTTTAIVGPSGSGKSTLLHLIAGLAQPSAGQVLLDGVDAADLTEPARRDTISMVFQHPFLFDGTIAENVRTGRPGTGDLAEVARLARVDELVRRAPRGWETRVGEAGAALSGGERQRVSIARALLKPAPVLLLDEATSALDTENEAAIGAALTEDPTPRTRIVVTHRLASIRTADRAVFIEAGRVVEDGTIADLLAAGGRFADFWHAQEHAADWRLA